ncbi:phage tail protein [Falsihalocynthiibacter sp. BN13B15]|uniref:phage tail protein n=1 Tax=Falsihalocynthiibacter sp. BN13B15 TaxID=3240871 RepID=UPI00350F0ECE
MPFVTAAVAAIGTFFAGLTLEVVGAFLIRTIASIAVNVLVNTLLGSKEKKQPAIGVTGALSSGGDVPRSFILGQSRVDGSLVYRNTWGNAGATPNAYYTRVIALSDLPHSQLLEFYVDGEKVTLGDIKHGNLGYPIEEYSDAGGVYLWINYYDGTQTTADPLLVAHASPERPYPATRVGVGMCYAVITARSKPALFSAGWPSYHFVLSSTPFYDLSKDSSQGGAGPQRWNDPTTWGGDGDDLPVVQAYNILRGIFYNSTWFYGTRGLSSGRLPSAKWIAEINKCRTPTEGLNGFAPRYRCSGELRVSSEPASALEAALMTCSGRIADIGGVYYPHIGEPEAPVASFTDAEILATEEESFVPFRRLHDTVNGITATYTEPSEGYVTKAAPPLYNANFEAEDGNRRLTSNVDLQMVPYSEQVQRLMAEALSASRRNRRHTLFLPPAYSTVLNNEVLAWTSEKYSYDAKQFIINGRVLLDDGSIALELGEVDPEDYTPPAANSYVPVTPSPVVLVRPSSQAVLNFAVAPDSVVDGSAQGRLPAILATWDTSLDDIEALHVRVRLEGVAASSELLLLPNFEDGSARIIAGILPDTDYEVSARLVPNAARAVSWTSWLKVTTPDVRFGYIDLAPAIEAEITAAQTQSAAAAEGVVTLSGEVTAVQDNLAAQIAASDLEFGTVNSELAATGILAQAAVAGGGLIMDPYFVTFDESADDWEKTGDVDPVGTPNEVYPVGQTLTMTTLLGQDCGTYLKYSQSGWTGGIDHEGYVVELTFEVVAGDPQSTGMRVSWIENSFKSDYISLQEANDGAAIEVGKLYTISFIAIRPTSISNPVIDMGVYLYGSKDNFGDGANQPNTTKFHRCAMRPATPEELGGGIIDAAITAAVNTETTARVSSEAALANATQTVQSNLDDTDATVSSQATTLAAVDGFAQASAGLTVTTNGGNIAGFIATSFSNPNGSGGSLLELLGSVVKAGTIAANKLSVGFNTNRIVNSNFLDGLTNWFSWGSGGAHSSGYYQVRAAGSSFAGKLYPTLTAYCGSAGIDGYQVFENKPVTSAGGMVSFGMPVSAGDWVEASAKLSTHRCRRVIRIRWRDSDNVYISDSTVEDLSTTGTIGGNSNPADWPKYGGKAQAPANAAYATWQILKWENLAGTSSYIFIHEPVLCLTTADATELTTYSPDGTTLISGGVIIAETIYTSHLNTVEFAAAGLAIFGGAMKSTNFNGAISGDDIPSVGTVGWAVSKNGKMVLHNLVVRGSIVGGAVSNGADMLAAIGSPVHIVTLGSQVGSTISTGVMGSSELWIIALRGEYRHQKLVYGAYNSGNGTTPVSTYRTQLELWMRERSVGGSWGGWYKKTNGVDSSSTTAWSVFEHSYTVMGKGIEMQLKLILGSAGPAVFNASGDQSSTPDVTYTCVKNLGLSAKAVVK